MIHLDISKLENVQKLPGGSLRSGCPACMANGGDPQKTHLYIYPDGRFGCAANKSDELHTKEILRLAAKNENEIQEAPKEYSFDKPDLEVEMFFKEEDLDRLMPITTYWNGRHISDETLSIFRGGLSTNNKMNGRFCFPIFNETGQIHGMTGRWTLQTNNDVAWKHLGKTSSWVYPLYFNLEEIKLKGSVVLVESVGDMLALWEAGIKNVLVIFGTTLSQTLLSRLVSLNPQRIYVATNNDIKAHQAGQRAAVKIAQKMLKFFNDEIVEIKLPPKKDFGLMEKHEIQEWGKELYVRK